MIAWLSLAVALGGTLPKGHAIVNIGGMDCAGCLPELEEAFGKVAGVTGARASFTQARACVSLGKAVEAGELERVVTEAGFTVNGVAVVPECPRDLLPGSPRELWSEAGELDVVVVSRGEEIDLASVLVPGKFTIVDFGAPWCGPCVTGAAEMLETLEARPDVAVRAIVLPGLRAKESFDAPVAKQHLKWAPGLPYIVVFGPDGTERYRGSDVAAALAALS